MNKLLDVLKEQEVVNDAVTAVVANTINSALKAVEDHRCKVAENNIGNVRIELHEGDLDMFTYTFDIEVSTLKISMLSYGKLVVNMEVPYENYYREHLMRLYNAIENKR